MSSALLTLKSQRCFFHLEREAAAHCPSCKRSYCRECITENNGKIICRPCLDRLQNDNRSPDQHGRLKLGAIFRLIFAFSFVLIFFYCCASFLSRLPDDFQDGSVWAPFLEILH